MTFSCPGCCTARSCAARWRTPGSSRSTPRQPRVTPRSMPSSPARCSRTASWPGCRPCRATSRRAWPPTRCGSQARRALATSAVRCRGQEAPFVVAEARSSARDALELISVEYEPLPVVIDVTKALDPGAPVIRDDLDGKQDNHIFDWAAGDKAATDAVFAAADVVVVQDMLYPRSHPAPLETCGTVADMDTVSGKLTVWSTTQAPHAHRTLYAMITGLPEHKIRIVSPDIGGGFGNKVPIYPGYIC